MNIDWLIIYVHAIAGILFLGNMIVTFVWKWYADKTGDLRLMKFGADLVIKTDWIFIAPMAGILVGTGLLLAHLRGYPILETHWLLGALVFFSLSGIVWTLKLIPNQRRQQALLASAESAEAVSTEHALLRSDWLRWGILATVFALAALLMMFLK